MAAAKSEDTQRECREALLGNPPVRDRQIRRRDSRQAKRMRKDRRQKTGQAVRRDHKLRHGNPSNGENANKVRHCGKKVVKSIHLPSGKNAMAEFESKPAYRITDLHEADRPRERLASLGPQALSNAELIAILLRVGVKGENAVTVGQRLLKTFGGLGGLHRAPFAELKKQHGLGEAKASQIKAAIELGRRLTLESPEERPTINTRWSRSICASSCSTDGTASSRRWRCTRDRSTRRRYAWARSSRRRSARTLRR